MKNRLLLAFIFIPFYIYSFSFNNTLIKGSSWFAMSNDSFGFGLPIEPDDLLTVGFMSGIKRDNYSLSINYDIYTFRGENRKEKKRFDDFLIGFSLFNSYQYDNFEFRYSGKLSLGVQGYLGGLEVQENFHLLFLNTRPIPQSSDYIDNSFIGSLGLTGDLLYKWDKSTIGVSYSSNLKYPLLLDNTLTLFYQLESGNKLFRSDINHSSLLNGEDNIKQLISDYNLRDFYITNYISSGNVFYYSAYNPMSQTANGYIGVTSNNNSGNSGLWRVLEAGVELTKQDESVVFEENSVLGISFDIEDNYLWYIQLKNGGLYKSIIKSWNVRNTSLSGGVEKKFNLINNNSIIVDSGIAGGIMGEFIRHLDLTGYRAKLLDEMANLSLEFRPYIDLYFLLNSNSQLGLRFTPFIIIPFLSHGDSTDAFKMAREPRWGIRLSLLGN